MWLQREVFPSLMIYCYIDVCLALWICKLVIFSIMCFIFSNALGIMNMHTDGTSSIDCAYDIFFF